MFSTLLVLFLFLSYGSCGVEGDEECSVDTDCDMELAVCKNKMCVCPDGFVKNSDMTKCLQGANGYGDKCEDSLQCSYTLESGGYCSNGTCKCNDKYHYLRGKCWKTSGLGEKCHKNENCYVSHDFESATCDNQNKTCKCSDGYYQREYSSCRRISGPGQPCGIALDCKGCDNAVCTKARICNCSNAQVKTKEATKENVSIKKTLLKSISSPHVGDNCTKPEDCNTNVNLICNKGKCMCETGYYASADEASCHPELGSSCGKDSDCIGKNMMCRPSKNWCTCKAGFVAADGNQFCEKMSRNISWSCLKTEECSFFGPGGICVKKKCACSPTSHFVVDQLYCWTTKKVGEHCQSNLDCGLDTSVESCTESKCKCTAGHHSAAGGTECRRDSTKLGEPCIDDQDCVFPNAECSANKTCGCALHYVANNGVCLPGIGSKCVKDGDCTTNNSTCLDGFCACREGSVTSHDWSACLPVVNSYGAPCQEVEQCTKFLGIGATCEKKVCLCAKGYHHVEGHTCFLDKNITEPCVLNSECTAPHSNCLKGVCTCDYNYVPDIKRNTCNGGNILTLSGFLGVVLMFLLSQL